jgi:peptidoglycan/LPS O-acetylase OafA/YrhL
MKPIRIPRIDKRMADLSYPVFLRHWLVGYLVALVFFPGERRGISLAIFTLMAATGFSWLLCKLQNSLVEPLRSRIRTKGLRQGNRQDRDTFQKTIGSLDRPERLA